MMFLQIPPITLLCGHQLGLYVKALLHSVYKYNEQNFKITNFIIQIMFDEKFTQETVAIPHKRPIDTAVINVMK